MRWPPTAASSGCLFLSSTTSAATSTDIETYNTHVQTAAAGHAAIRDYSEGFRAVASTAAIDARDNTATTGPSAPIYWLGGAQIADHYGDFYDGTWDDEVNVTDESGAAYSALGSPHAVWTGSHDSGVEHFHSGVSRALGASPAERGGINNPDRGDATPNPLYGNGASASTDLFPLYAISEVFTVGPNPAFITNLAITSDPGSDQMYQTGDIIEVTATFGEAVTVSGRPRIKLRLGQTEQSDRWAEADPIVGTGVIAAGQERVLVKNIQETFAVGATELLGATTKAAQAFTTGPVSDGYRLGSIRVYLQIIDPSAAGDHLTATLNANDNGNPGAVLCTLSDPTTFRVSFFNTFDAPTANPCPILAANTTYFVVIERVVVTTDTILVWTAEDGNEDSDAASGWSIGDSSHAFASGSWSETADEPTGSRSTAPRFCRSPGPPIRSSSPTRCRPTTNPTPTASRSALPARTTRSTSTAGRSTSPGPGWAPCSASPRWPRTAATWSTGRRRRW